MGDRQALEVDRLGSDQKRNPCETNGAGIDIHPYAAPLNISWGEKQFTPKSIHGARGEPYNCLLECSNVSDLSQIWPSRDSFELCCGSLCEKVLVTHSHCAGATLDSFTPRTVLLIVPSVHTGNTIALL